MLWNCIYETGVDIVDEQNKELFRRVEMLLDHRQSAIFPHTLSKLPTYFIHHFETEEKMHSLSKYPKAKEHNQVHGDFLEAFKKLRVAYDKCQQDPVVLMRIAQSVFKWMKTHIRTHDKPFATYFVAHCLSA